MAQLRIAETDTEGIEEIEENANFQTSFKMPVSSQVCSSHSGQVLKSLYKALSRKSVQDRQQERRPGIEFHGIIAMANSDPIYRPS
ncbi:hypothetical protein QG37_00881 [Candidozyma auris]|nr:hypothetical protein QG37_00881 [[Candida] auris]